jgi:DNA-binding FrmR family transcriptional regulator
VRGSARLAEDARYCFALLPQMQAFRATLNRVVEHSLREHAAHCVAHAIQSGNAKDQTKKFAELVELFSRYGK